MTSEKEMNMNMALLFDNLSFKCLTKIMLKREDMRHSTQTNHHLSVQGALFQIECNEESLMDSEISRILYQINLFSDVS